MYRKGLILGVFSVAIVTILLSIGLLKWRYYAILIDNFAESYPEKLSR